MRNRRRWFLTIGGAFDVGVTLLGGGHSNNPLDENIVPMPFDTTQITSAENGSNPKPGDPCHPLAAGAHAPAIAFAQNQRDEIRVMPYVGALAAEPGAKQQTYILEQAQQETIAVHGTQDPDTLIDQAHTLGRNQGQENAIVAGTICKDSFTGGAGGRPEGAAANHFVPNNMQVRRLTPRECERLQGFPDDYTRIPWRAYQAAMRKGSGAASLRASYEAILAEHGKTLREPAGEDCPDGPRYKALGNSMAVPVMRWIGQRIDAAAKFGN